MLQLHSQLQLLLPKSWSTAKVITQQPQPQPQPQQKPQPDDKTKTSSSYSSPPPTNRWCSSCTTNAVQSQQEIDESHPFGCHRSGSHNWRRIHQYHFRRLLVVMMMMSVLVGVVTVPVSVVVPVHGMESKILSATSNEEADMIDALIQEELLLLSMAEQEPSSVADLIGEDDEDIILLDDVDSTIDNNNNDHSSHDDNVTNTGGTNTTIHVEVPVNPSQSIPMNNNNNNNNNTTTIHVVSNLESMSNEELKAICTERGYDIPVIPTLIPTTSTSGAEDNISQNTITLTHEDYVKAATQCLALEQSEINSRLSEQSDTTSSTDAENVLEQEIERLRIEKERLELERTTLLQDIQSLQDQVQSFDTANDTTSNQTSTTSKNATTDTSTSSSSSSSSSLGPIDTSSIGNNTNTSTSNSMNTTNPPTNTITNTTSATTTPLNVNDLSAEEVLRESFVQLFDRVGADLQFVGRIVYQFLILPTATACTFIWTTTLHPIWIQSVHPTLQQSVLQPIQPYIRPIVAQLSQQIRILQDVLVHNDNVRTIVPMIRKQYRTMVQIVTSLSSQIPDWFHSQRNEIQFPIRIVGAFVVPLFQSLSIGVQLLSDQMSPWWYNVTSVLNDTVNGTI
jgi:hypothetical protein